MRKVIDCTGPADIAKLKSAGVSGVIRYVGGPFQSGKEAHRSELDAYRKAGISVGAVYETSVDQTDGGYERGQAHARTAQASILALGFPADAPIYFACDKEHSDGTNRYLDGAASVLGKNRVGIYGGYATCKSAIEGGHAKYAWQTYAWSAGRWYPKAQLWQHNEKGRWWGSLGCDYDANEATAADWGQEHRPIVKPTTGPSWPGNFGPPGLIPLRTWSAKPGTQNYRAITTIQKLVGAAVDGVIGAGDRDSTGRLINAWRVSHGLSPRSNGVWDKDCWKIAFPGGWS